VLLYISPTTDHYATVFYFFAWASKHVNHSSRALLLTAHSIGVPDSMPGIPQSYASIAGAHHTHRPSVSALAEVDKTDKKNSQCDWSNHRLVNGAPVVLVTIRTEPQQDRTVDGHGENATCCSSPELNSGDIFASSEKVTSEKGCQSRFYNYSVIGYSYS
jgi:hypothetical protein